MKKYVTLKIPVPVLSKQTMCGILLIIFALYNILATFYLAGFDSYFRIIINAFMLIATAVIFVKSKDEDVPENHSTFFKITAHIIMFISVLLLPLIIHLLMEGLKTAEPSGIFVFVSNIFFPSRSANDYFQFLWNSTQITIVISIIIALISVYKYGFVHISVISHAIVNIACAGTVSRLLSDIQAPSGGILSSISAGFSSIIFVCVATAVLAIIIPIVSMRIHQLKL